MPETQGLLNAVYDSTNRALRFIAPNGTYVPKSLPSYVTGGAGRYDAARSIYNATPTTLLPLRAAIGKAKSTLCRMSVIGDSEAEGFGAGTAVGAWPILLRDILASALGLTVAGTGTVYPSNQANLPDARWTLGSNTTKGSLVTVVATNATASTFVSDVAGTIVEVKYADTATGTLFNVAIDGGAAVPVTGTTDNAAHTYSVTGLANTTHTVVITAGTVTGRFFGVTVRNAGGLMMTNSGVSGTKTADWTTTTFATNIEPIALYDVPDICFVSLGVNDTDNAVALATSQANLVTLLNLINSGRAVVLVGQMQPSPTALADWQAYTNMLYGLADTYGIPLVDINDAFGSYAAANTQGMITDTVHPNLKGYRFIADRVARLFLL